MKKINTIASSIQGTVQGTQIPKALDPGYFQVDERDKAQLMAFCAKFAGVLDYYNLQDKPDGGWDSFLLADITVLAALIGGTDHESGYEKFLDFKKGILAATRWKAQKLFAQRFFNTVFDVVHTIDQWYKLSGQNFSSNTLKEFLNGQISSDGSEAVNEFYSFYFHLSENLPAFKNEALARFKTLDAAWDFNPFPQTTHPVIAENNRKDFLKQTVQCAIDSGQRLFALQAGIVDYAKVEFLNSLERSDMPAHIGLLSAFMDLFANHQGALNTFTKKHLDFYYRSVLGFKPGKALPDATYITFQLAPTQQEVIIPEGSAFTAGKDERGNTITFASRETVKINATQIRGYRTVNFVSQEKSSLLHGIYTGCVDNFNSPGNDRWPFWGSDASTANLTVAPATLGFAFSAPDLWLAEGVRTITIALSLTLESRQVIAALEQFLAADVNTVLPSFFEVQFTTRSEWKGGNIHSMVYDHQGMLSMAIDFPAGYPAITCYQEKVHGPGFISAWPLCKVTITDPGKKYYNVLQKLAFNSIAITTTATGVSGLVVENDGGKLVASGTFIPFHDQNPGANLYCGGSEFFVKPMEYIKLGITWEKLPESFSHYYEAYNDYYRENSIPFQFENQVFEATLSVLRNGAWDVIADTNEKPILYSLFTADATTTTHEAPIIPNNEKIITINGANIPYNPELEAFTALSPSLSEGFVKLTFTNPEEGFGAIDYPTIVSAVTLENSIAALHNAGMFVFRKKKIRPYPNVPYIPKIAHLAASYRSVNRWDVSPSAATLQWCHIHPLGTELVSFGKGTVSLLPVYEYAANVYLGLSPVTPGDLLSVFISITNRVRSVSNPVSQGLSYVYLSINGWKALPVSEDATEGFQKSGIIRFVLPDDFSSETSLMPGGLCWIRCSCVNGNDVTTDFITTQAIQVSRRSAPGENVLVSAGTIRKPDLPIAGLQRIMQPVRSAGGRPAQTETQFNNTVASRLRYKKRVISLKDMEDLVLHQFPELFKVTAIPQAYYDTKSPGIIKVVVVPFTSSQEEQARRPYASSTLMLEVWKYLSGISMPFTSFEITNPDFDELKVQCSVKFTQAYDHVKWQTQLQDDIGNFLSPWIMDNPVLEAIPKLYTSSALYSFIKTRPYIQYVSAFDYSLLSKTLRDDYVVTVGDVPAPPEQAIINPVTPWSLVIPATKHEIKVVNSSGQEMLSSSPDVQEGLRIGETFYLTN